VVTDFLYYFLSTQTDRLRKEQSGFGQPNLNTEIVSNLKISLPPLPEQQQIVSCLDEKNQQIDDLISKEQRKIELLQEYRQSLISDAVTGKIDVREAV
jgi:type I restriction enzyme S subunit